MRHTVTRVHHDAWRASRGAQGRNSLDRHVLGGHVDRLKHDQRHSLSIGWILVLSLRSHNLLESTLGRLENTSNPHRIPSHWWRHHLENIVGGANAVNSFVMRSSIPWNVWCITTLANKFLRMSTSLFIDLKRDMLWIPLASMPMNICWNRTSGQRTYRRRL